MTNKLRTASLFTLSLGAFAACGAETIETNTAETGLIEAPVWTESIAPSESIEIAPHATKTPPEVHVINVYTSYDGTMHIHVTRPGEHVLVMTAYEPTTWEVSAGPGAKIVRAVASGYHHQAIVAPATAAIETSSYEDNSPSYHYGPPSLENLNPQRALGWVWAFFGHPTSFTGCYQMGSVALELDGSASADCDVGAGYELSHVFWDHGSRTTLRAN